MSKAILVIDINDADLSWGKESIRDLLVSYKVFGKGGLYCYEDVDYRYVDKQPLLKPLPQKKDPFEEIENIINQKLNKKETDEKIDKIRSYSEGYNDCLEDIIESGTNNEMDKKNNEK